MPEQKNWFRRHWIISVIGAIILIPLLLGFFGGMTGKEDTSKSGQVSQVSTTSQVNAPSEESTKTSGYTLDDCLSACNSYCIQTQTDVCQSSCQMIGKPGSTMDKTVNSIKNATTNLSC